MHQVRQQPEHDCRRSPQRETGEDVMIWAAIIVGIKIAIVVAIFTS